MNGVSVVIPVHNGSATLSDVLSAVASQAVNERPLEIIAVDDASRDTSSAVLAAMAERFPIRTIAGPGRGAAAAVNRGIEAARHPFIAQIDQDVVVEPGWLERVLERFDDPRVGAVQGHYVARRTDGFFARVMALDLDHRYAKLEDQVDHVCTGNTVYRAEALAAVGYLNESLGYGYDNDLSYRLSAAGYRLVFCPEARSHHHWRDGLWGYVTQQYGFGYGRLDVVAAHPERVTGDAVSPASMMAHPAVTTLAVTCLAAAAIGRWFEGATTWLALVGVGLMAGLVIERTVAGFSAWRRFGDPAALAFPVVHTVRNLAWVAAIAAWTCRRLRGRQGGPAASMTPRRAGD